MEEQKNPISLPLDYNENTLYLLVQSPTVLYAYWELSPGLKEALNEKARVQIRLNVEGRGHCRTCDIDLQDKRSFYFTDIEPGLSYNCEFGLFNSGNQFYPLLRSNSVTAPHDRPSGDLTLPESHNVSSFIFSASSWALSPNKK